MAIAHPESRRATSDIYSKRQPSRRLVGSAGRVTRESSGTVTCCHAPTRTYPARAPILQPDARIALGMTANVALSDEASSREGENEAAGATDGALPARGKPARWSFQADQTLALKPVVVAVYTEKEALRRRRHIGERYVVAGVHKLAVGEKIKAVDLKTDTAAADENCSTSRMALNHRSMVAYPIVMPWSRRVVLLQARTRRGPRLHRQSHGWAAILAGATAHEVEDTTRTHREEAARGPLG